MTRALALADDAVSVGLVRVAGGADPGRVRAQLAAVPTPSVRAWVFVRRLSVRATPSRLGPALRDALDGVARGQGSERIAFPDFSAMAMALGEDARAGRIGLQWHWRMLDLPAAPGAALAALIAAEPMRVWEALIAWRRAALLPSLWPLLADADAHALVAAVSAATLLPPPAFAAPVAPPPRGTPAPAAFRQAASPSLAVVREAAAFWEGAVPPECPALREAAVYLSLLRWAPAAFANPAALRHAAAETRAALEAGPRAAAPVRPALPDAAVPAPPAPAAPDDVVTELVCSGEGGRVPVVADADRRAPPEREVIVTAYGGVFFLINALERIGIRRRLAAWPEEEVPSGFALLLALALRGGLAEDDPLVGFLAGESGNPPPTPPALREGLGVGTLYAELAALYPREPDDPPGLHFLRQPASLLVAPLHLDLHLATSAIDLRIRRAALDRDPGWVPWLGRIVRFHYPAIPARWARPR